MRTFNIVFIVVFVLFAALQYNDPDPYMWVPIYLYAAFLCYRAMQKKYDPVLYSIGLLIYGGYAVYLFFDRTGVLDWAEAHHAENLVQTMKATKPWIEETREFGGLAIILIVMTVNFFWLRRSRKSHTAYL